MRVAKYGQRFRALRLGSGWKPGQAPKFTQEELMGPLAYDRAASVSNFERSDIVPQPDTIKHHAQALQAEPWELLLGVPTAYDRLRWPDLSDAQLETLLAGLKAMAPKQRAAVLRACAEAVAALPEPLIREGLKRGRVSSAATPGKVGRTDRGKKSA